jgi:hypothetical protein
MIVVVCSEKASHSWFQRKQKGAIVSNKIGTAKEKEEKKNYGSIDPLLACSHISTNKLTTKCLPKRP